MSFRSKLRLSWLTVALAVVAWVGLTEGGFAQSMNAGDIRGVVTDVSGAILPDVTVTVVNKNTGVTKILTTNQDGLFDTASIVTGTYEITFSKPGFQTLVRSSITVNVENITVNAQLTVGAVTEQVVVNTDVPLLSTENAEQSTTLTARQLSELPQVGQDWQNFTILLPGGSGAPMAGGTQGANNPGQVISVNGNLPYSTVLADGAAITLPSSANADVMVLDTIQEVKIGTSAFSAQYGIGGIMFNQISKGGTDRFHGDVYEFFQNDALNAASYAFANVSRSTAISRLRYNNFGFSIGGPVLKRKLFFFFNYDKIKNPGASTPTFTTVPTAAMLSGDFTGQSTLYDPATTTLVNGVVHRTSFADEYGQGNKIPASRLDPLAQAIQKYYPAPNTPGTVANGLTSNNFLYNIPNAQPFTKFFGRMDYDIRGNNRLTATVQQSDNPAFSNGQGICPINCQSQDVSRYNAQITDVWTISPNVINEFRLGYTNQLNFFTPSSLGKGFPAKLGWQYAKADIFPTININGYYQLTPATNAVYKEHVYDPSDVVTLIRGKHILHFGGEFLFFRDNSTAWGNINGGTMGFTGQYTASTQGDSSTGLAYADFLLGQMQNWNAQVTPEYGARMRVPQLFVQDDFKLTPNLTLNLGLRYQIQSGWGEVKGNMATFDPTVQNPVSGNLGAMWFGTTKANGRSRLQSPVYTTVLPRVGFAWLMRPNATIRGGFGLYAYNWSLDAYGGSSAGPAMGGAFGSRGSVADTTNGVTPVGILGGNGANLPYIPASTDPGAFNGTDVNYIQYHAPVGGSYQWNLSVQEEITPDLVTEITYVGSHGHDLPFPVDINQVPENKLGPSDITLRGYPQFGHLFGSTNNAISNYNSLQAVIQKRMSHGLDFNFNYVWAHFLSEMDSSGWGSRAGAKNYQRSFDPSANYANSNFDVRNAFKGSVLYQLPFGKGRAFVNNNTLLDTLIGGWQTSGTVVVQSGQPFTVSMQTDNSFAQSQNSQWYPNVIGIPKLSHHGAYHGTNQWFNEAAFAVPTPGTFGNAGRNLLNGPGLSQVNFSLGKTFNIWESVKFQLRADANNIFNHPSFNLPTTGGTEQSSAQLIVNPDGTIATGTSTIRSVTVPGRTMQLSGRISF